MEKGGGVGGGNGRGKTFADAGVQTYIEVQSVGIQVSSDNLLSSDILRRPQRFEKISPAFFELTK